MSSVNPTRVNGEELQQAERLKHGDVITIIDRSFRWVSINISKIAKDVAVIPKFPF
jgi:pSer/pThr/pTyr-binding forkhead associated (FHA) protein